MKIITWLGISIGVLAGGVTVWLACRKRLPRGQRLPSSAGGWQHLGTLKTINFYPVKGGAPILLESVECSEFGLYSHGLWERCLVAYDPSGAVVFAGSYPRMLSVSSTIVSEKVLRLNAPNLPSIAMDLNELLREPYQVLEIYKNGLRKRLVECRAEHHQWLSRAVLQQESGLRFYVKLQPLNGVVGDIFPVMVVNERSVHDLNDRLRAKNITVDCQQFRGNLVIESNADRPPYDEDRWAWLKIGIDAERLTILSYNSDCLRCILVNVHVENYSRNADFEPLRILKKYRLRKSPKEPSMGVYFDVFKYGVLNKGDPIYVCTI